jgi:hypothetical protein
VGVVRGVSHQHTPGSATTGRIDMNDAPQDGTLRTRYAYLICRKAHQGGDCKCKHQFPYWVAETLVLAVLEFVSRHNEWWRNSPEQNEIDWLTKEIAETELAREQAAKKWKESNYKSAALGEGVDNLTKTINRMQERLAEIARPGHLAELYAPARLDYLFDLHKRGLAATDDERGDIRHQENDIIRAAVQKVILKSGLEMTIQLQPTFGSFLEFTFDYEGNYIHHGTRDAVTGEMTDLDPKICMVELNRILNKWGFSDDLQWQTHDTHDEWRSMNEAAD